MHRFTPAGVNLINKLKHDIIEKPVGKFFESATKRSFHLFCGKVVLPLNVTTCFLVKQQMIYIATGGYLLIFC